jgi:hypothetical protein
VGFWVGAQVQPPSPAARFTKWRTRTRICFVAGVALYPVAQQAPLSPRSVPGRLALAAGVALLTATFVLYFRYCNKCPRRGESFSRAPEYESSDTSGLPLFGRIERCPFCAEPLLDDRPSG